MDQRLTSKHKSDEVLFKIAQPINSPTELTKLRNCVYCLPSSKFFALGVYFLNFAE